MMDDRGMRLIESLLKVGLMHLGGLAMGRMHLCRVEQSLRSSFALRLVAHFFPDTKLTWMKKNRLATSPPCIKAPGANAPSPSKSRHHDSLQIIYTRN
jgi:hypothetical protein